MGKNLTYVAFLRGINVGGHHKLPMSELKKELVDLGFENVITLLNSGNVIFEAVKMEETDLEKKIADRLENTFGFPVPVLVRKGEEILQLFSADPFSDIAVTNDIRLYVSFLKQHPQEIKLPWVSEDESFKIIQVENRTIFSVLDLMGMGTTKGMESLEKIFGKNLTTRNWNTIERIVEKL